MSFQLYARVFDISVYREDTKKKDFSLQRIPKKKRWWSVVEGLWARSGPKVQQPVILPPMEAGSDRSSVKPASRCACHFRAGEAKQRPSPKPLRPNYATWNGQAGKITTTWGPGSESTPNIRSHLSAPAWVTGSRY